MSGQLNITFAPDMPAASVEVISPDMQVVERIMLEAGRSKTVQVPSERSFLRVHLPSGQVVTLKDPSGSLSRVVSMQSVLAQTAPPSARVTSVPGFAAPARRDLQAFESDESAGDFPSKARIARYHKERAWAESTTPAYGMAFPLASYGTARLFTAKLKTLPGISVARGREAHWEVHGNPREPPLSLEIERPPGSILTVRLPGDVQRAWVRADRLHEQKAVTFSVRISTSEPAADTILGYFQRGDFYSAESMHEWVDEAREMLLYKKRDPYAAAVGAYLLLRLKKFSHLHDWAKNLANWFDFLPDGCVIWAWQLLHDDRTRRVEIRDYLLKAAQRGLPVYSEGLRLLIDGLRLLGHEGQEALEEVRNRAGVVVWDSPLTASICTTPTYSPTADTQTVVYDISFATKA